MFRNHTPDHMKWNWGFHKSASPPHVEADPDICQLWPNFLNVLDEAGADKANLFIALPLIHADDDSVACLSPIKVLSDIPWALNWALAYQYIEQVLGASWDGTPPRGNKLRALNGIQLVHPDAPYPVVTLHSHISLSLSAHQREPLGFRGTLKLFKLLKYLCFTMQRISAKLFNYLNLHPLSPPLLLLFFFEDAEGFAGELKFYEFMDVPIFCFISAFVPCQRLIPFLINFLLNQSLPTSLNSFS